MQNALICLLPIRFTSQRHSLGVRVPFVGVRDQALAMQRSRSTCGWLGGERVSAMAGRRIRCTASPRPAPPAALTSLDSCEAALPRRLSRAPASGSPPAVKRRASEQGDEGAPAQPARTHMAAAAERSIGVEVMSAIVARPRSAFPAARLAVPASFALSSPAPARRSPSFAEPARGAALTANCQLAQLSCNSNAANARPGIAKQRIGAPPSPRSATASFPGA